MDCFYTQFSSNTSFIRPILNGLRQHQVSEGVMGIAEGRSGLPAELPAVRACSTAPRVRLCATDLVKILGLDSISVLPEQLIF